MSERDPLSAARAFAIDLGAVAPPVPTIELAADRPTVPTLARFRLGQVADHGWAPSLALVGRRAVGKSTLALALADFASTGDDLAACCVQTSWGGALVAYDTPGLRTAGRPGVRAWLAEALARDPPDVMLAVFSATEVDAGVDDDVADLAALARAWTPRRAPPPALLAALHRVDELPPFDLDADLDDPERAVAVATATRVLRARLSPLDGRCPIVATAARASDPGSSGIAALREHARALVVGRLGAQGDRSPAFERALGALAAGDDAAAVARLRRRWDALDEEARRVLLHPRGWSAMTGGRSEPG